MSTESSIPDFRSVDGLYHQQYDYPPETILSHSFYLRNPSEFYRDKMVYLDAQPNDCHVQLARLEQAGKLTAVVTQNIDGLHQKAGSQTVFELHSSVHRNFCTKWDKSYDLALTLEGRLPLYTYGGMVKPDKILTMAQGYKMLNLCNHYCANECPIGQ